MSEPISGVELESKPRPIRDAAAIILVREASPGGREVFWVRRGPRVSFSGGFHAFPGGKVDREDAEIAIAGTGDDDAAHRVCAIRETFEEAGVLLGTGVDAIDEGRLREMRKALLAGGSFKQLLAAEGIELDGSCLIPAGRWLTPSFSAIRFNARFYLSRVASDTVAEVIPGELSEGGWIRPDDALAEWESGAVLLHPPNHHALAVLAGFPVESAMPLLQNPPFIGDGDVVERIEFQRGIMLFAMRTPTLPPAEHTHCYILGTGELALVDPGSPDDDEQERLARVLSELEREGRRLRYILLTHHHIDHSGAARALAKRFDVPILASKRTADRFDGVGRHLEDGDVIELDGPMPMRFRAVLTEGHADGHLIYYDESSRAVIAGDMVAGGSTIVIDPPEGNIAGYVASLERMRELPTGTIYPAHGAVIRDGEAKLVEYVKHRQDRLDQIRAALDAGETTIGELVATVYADTPKPLHPIAERSALASLLELERRGEVRRDGDRWRGVVSPD